MTRINTKYIKYLSFSAVLINISVLVYNLFTLNFFDDEVPGYYISTKKTNEVINLFSQNIHEDPGLYNLLLNLWMGLFGNSAPVARSLSLLFWILTIISVYFLTKSITKSKDISYVGIVLLCLLPHHWLYPIAARWYSLAGFLVVMNLLSFTKMFYNSPLEKKGNLKNNISLNGWELVWALGYVLSGSLLWYTNYAAPAYFLASLVALNLSGIKWAKTKKLIYCYFGIFILYIPWLETFLRALIGSSGRRVGQIRGLVDPLMSLYVLVAGGTSVPQNVHISLPSLIATILLCYLIYLQFDRVGVMSLYMLVPFTLLSALGMLQYRYVMLFSPVFCLLVITSLYFSWTLNYRRVVISIALLFGFAWAGTFTSMISRDAWLAARWLDDYKSIVERYESRYSDTVFISDRESVFYYRDCADGPITPSADAYTSDTYQSCSTTSIDKFKKTFSQIENNSTIGKKKYILVMRGARNESERKMNATVADFRDFGLNLIKKDKFGNDGMVYWKNLVSTEVIPEHRIYVYVWKKKY